MSGKDVKEQAKLIQILKQVGYEDKITEKDTCTDKFYIPDEEVFLKAINKFKSLSRKEQDCVTNAFNQIEDYPRNHQASALKSVIMYELFRQPSPLTDVTMIAPENYVLYNHEGKLRRDTTSLKAAIGLAQKAKAPPKLLAQYWCDLGDLISVSNDHGSGSKDCYRQAFKLDKTCAATYLGSVDIRMRTALNGNLELIDKIDDIITEGLNNITDDKDRSKLFLLRGKNYAFLHQHGKANERLNRAAELDEVQKYNAHTYLAWVKTRQGKYDEAMDSVALALKSHRNRDDRLTNDVQDILSGLLITELIQRLSPTRVTYQINTENCRDYETKRALQIFDREKFYL